MSSASVRSLFHIVPILFSEASKSMLGFSVSKTERKMIRQDLILIIEIV